MPSRRSVTPALWSLVLQAASLALVAALAWQAWRAERSHRATAVGVLRDYAALAAGEMVRRATGEIGFAGLYPTVVALSAAPEGAPLPGPEELRAARDPRTARAATLVRATFRVSSGEIESRGEPLDALARHFLAGWLAEDATGAESAYTVAHPVLEGEVRTFVRAEGAATAPGRPRLGFEVDRESLGPRLQEAAERAPLLPESLVGEGSIEGGVAIRMTDPRGREVFSSGWTDGGTLTAGRTFGGDYGGLFEGYRVEASIDPLLAPRLVIGGLPRSRLPLLAALTLLAAALGAGAFLQARRERELARLRSDFVARVSHELRTPLAQIRLFAETLLLERVRSDRERRGRSR